MLWLVNSLSHDLVTWSTCLGGSQRWRTFDNSDAAYLATSLLQLLPFDDKLCQTPKWATRQHPSRSFAWSGCSDTAVTSAGTIFTTLPTRRQFSSWQASPSFTTFASIASAFSLDTMTISSGEAMHTTFLMGTLVFLKRYIWENNFDEWGSSPNLGRGGASSAA